MDVSADQAPLLELLFDSLGALSVTFGDAGNDPILEPGPGEVPLWQRTRVSALFEGEQDPSALRTLIGQTLDRDLSGRLRFERLKDQAWERAWLIGPGEQAPVAGEAVTVCLEPGLAFGTGTHPTTALCLRWLDGANVLGKTLIDYGCGSGILAIAALRLGAASAMAVDQDPQALEATRTNAHRNGVSNRLSVHPSTRLPPGQADILLANILADTLIALCDRLSARVKPGGTIVLSGILAEQAQAVGSAFDRCFQMQPPVAKQEWVLLAGHRKLD
jgi:ribosomal protein L11 methyltransferase